MIGCRTTWPAPPAADFWEGFTLRNVPSVRSPRRVPAPAAAPATRPPERRAARGETPGPLPCRGVAAVFEQWHKPTVTPGGAGLPHDLSLFLAPGCFDRSLRRIREGRAAFRLLAGHDRAWPIASYADGCLLLTQGGGRLFVTVLPFGRAGRAACREVRDLAARGFRELSIGASKAQVTHFGRFGIVTRAVLEEVSLVPLGANPGCSLLTA